MDYKEKLVIKDVYKTYDGKNYSVQAANLAVNQGEFVVLVGPSGCGKTTVLRMIAGLEDISRGEIIIDNQVVNQLEAKDRNLSMVFQNYALYPHMTVYKNMAIPLEAKKLSRQEIDKSVREFAGMLGLEDYLKRYPKELSGGQRQRVAIGRALTKKPSLFLMDEPLSNLDAKLRVKMRSELIKLHKKLGSTSIYVTHDQVEAMTMADRIVVMNEGKIQQIGRPEELYQKPSNLFVASFIGMPQMNFIDIRLEEGSCLLNGSKIRLRGLENLNKDLILGIRPENLSLTDRQEGEYFPIEIGHREYLGSHYLGEAMINQSKVQLIFKAEDIDINEKLYCKIDLESLHLFNKESGLRYE